MRKYQVSLFSIDNSFSIMKLLPQEPKIIPVAHDRRGKINLDRECSPGGHTVIAALTRCDSHDGRNLLRYKE